MIVIKDKYMGKTHTHKHKTNEKQHGSWTGYAKGKYKGFLLSK